MEEKNDSRNKAKRTGLKRFVCLVLGLVFLAVGMVGVAVPVLPTTPLVILAAACFATGSQRLHRWLLQSRLFGPYIQHYRTGGGIGRTRKLLTVLFLWAGLAVSMVLVRTIPVIVILSVVGVCVTAHLLTIKTQKQPSTDELVE